MSAYLKHLQEAAVAWSSGQGETDAWARAAIQALISGEHDPLSLSQTVYDKLRPHNARGQLVSPKVLRGRLSVRNLENSTSPVPGAAAARKNLETVLRIFDQRNIIGDQLIAFANGDERIKLYGLAALAAR